MRLTVTSERFECRSGRDIGTAETATVLFLAFTKGYLHGCNIINDVFHL